MKSRISTGYIRMIHRYAISVKEEELSLMDAVRYEPDLDFLCMRLESIDDPMERAAVAMHDIAYNHPFVEGNKRTALLLCENLLDDDVFITADEDSIYRFVLEVARGEHDVDDVRRWLEANTGHLPSISRDL